MRNALCVVTFFAISTAAVGAAISPSISSLSPSMKRVGDSEFTITIRGSDFARTSRVRFNGNTRRTIFVKQTILQASILASDLSSAGIFQINVSNGSSVSNSLPFTVANPLPSTTGISPSTRVAGSGAFTITVAGTNFVSSSRVVFNGVSLATTFVGRTELRAEVTAALIATAGNSIVRVSSPSPGGGFSNGQTFVTTPANGSDPIILVSEGTVWKYLDNGTNQNTAWRELSFIDASWQSGSAQLGYGDGDETTVVSYGPDPNNKFVTTYFRHAFSVADPSLFVGLRLRTLFDDGVIVYLNGAEVFRSNLPSLPNQILYNTLALTAVFENENVYTETQLPTALIQNGQNLIAVEIHQSSVTSSDISFNLSLEGLRSVQQPTRMRIAAVGDFDDDNDTRTVANMIHSWSPDLVIALGDLTYTANDTSTAMWDREVGQFYGRYIKYPAGSMSQYAPGSPTNKFVPVLGNHDWDAGIVGWYRYFDLPNNERYYDVLQGPVHLFVIDSDYREPDGRAGNSLQAQWLQARLAASTARWKFVMMHEPPFSSGAVHGSSTTMRWTYKEWGASALLAAHDHLYERLFVDGFPYFVNGLGGRNIYTFRTPPEAGSVVRFNGDYGAMLITASTDTLKFEFFSITNGGTLADSFLMTNQLGSNVSSHQLTHASELNDTRDREQMRLGKNYPNPFNPVTRISFTVPTSGIATLEVCDILGREVAILFEETAESGREYSVEFDASKFSSGIYFYSLISGGKRESRRLVVLK